MTKHTSKEAYFQRLKNLADVNKKSIKESLNRNLGSLIDYKRASDGIAYGIIKENHHYYIKKAGTKQDPNVSDFAYIGGMQNITGYQFTSLSEAEKQRNMMFHTIGEAKALKPNKSGSKMVLTEDVAGQEIDMAADKLGDLDAATSAEEVPAEAPGTEGSAEMTAGLENEPAGPDGTSVAPEETGAEELPADLGAPEGGEEGLPAPEDSEETPAPETNGEEGQTENDKEIEKSLGKLTNTLRKTELTDSQVKSYVNTFLSAFKDKFPDIEIEDRKEMANKITKVVPDQDIEDLGQNVEDTESKPDNVEETQQCAECGSFAKFAESRGYNAESIQECGEEEVGNLVSGYANAHNDGQNDGDLENVALVIKVINPEILNQLKSDYGHEDYADKLQPYVDGMNESTDEDNIAKLNELFGGLGYLGKKAGQAIGGAAKQVGQAIGGAAKNVYQAGAEKVGQVGQAIGQAATNVKQGYYAGEKNAAIGKLEQMAADLGKQVAAVNTNAKKAGQQPIDVNSILTTIKNQVGATGAANLGRFRTAEGMDVSNVQIQPEAQPNPIEEDVVAQKAGKKLSATGAPVKIMKEEDEIESEENIEEPFEKSGDKPLDSFAPAAQNLGVATVKPDGAPTTGVDININPDKSVNISMNESEAKLRKYIRNRLEEKTGKKKPNLNENTKSTTLKKLDAAIDKQFNLFETVIAKKNSVNEVFGLSTGEKVGAANPQDTANIERLFNKAFGNILNNPQMGVIGRAAKTTPSDVKYNILKQFVQGKGGTLRLTPDGRSVQYAPQSVKNAAIPSGTVGHVFGGGAPVNEILGFSVKEKFAKLNPQDIQGINNLFTTAFKDILTNPKMGAIARAANTTAPEIKYQILKQYADANGGTLRLQDLNTVKYASQAVKNIATPSGTAGGHIFGGGAPN